MELTTGSVRRLYFRFLSAAFGSALISSIYGMVDMAMVGQYQGPAGSAILAVLSWAWIWLFERDVLLFFGADETLLPLAQAYLKPVKCVFPVFLLTQLLTAFLRNDGRPGLATAIGACVSLLVMASHFVSKKCTLRLVRVPGLFGKLRTIAVTGVSRVYSSNCQRTRTAGLFVLRCAIFP